MKIIESGDKVGMMSEDIYWKILLLQKNIPNLYPKLLHPVHGIDKNWVYAFVKRRLYHIALIEWTDYRFIQNPLPKHLISNDKKMSLISKEDSTLLLKIVN